MRWLLTSGRLDVMQWLLTSERLEVMRWLLTSERLEEMQWLLTSKRLEVMQWLLTSGRLEVMQWLLTLGRHSIGSWVCQYLISWDASILFPGKPRSYFLGHPSAIIIHVPVTGGPDLAELMCINMAQHAIVIICISAWSEPEDHDMLMLVSVVDILTWYDILVINTDELPYPYTLAERNA